MGITTDLLDQIEPFTGSWSRSTGVNSLLALLQEGQDELMDCETSGLIWKGTENKGFPPYLITVADTYRYEITESVLSNVSSITKKINATDTVVKPRNVLRVFVDTNSNFDYDRHFVGEPILHSFNNPMRNSEDRIEIAEIPVDREPARENDNAAIMFQEDPGATTDIYFVEFTWEAPRLTGETIPLVVPAKFYPALRDYVIGTVSQLDNGKSNERLERFYTGYDRGGDWVPSWKEQFRAYYDTSAQSNVHQTVPLW